MTQTNKIATIGFFDGVHLGHRHLISQVVAEAARRQGIPVVVTFRSHPRSVISGQTVPLLTTEDEKVALLHECGIDQIYAIDFTSAISQMSAREFMQRVLSDQLGVTTLVIGYDHRFGRGRSEGFDDYVFYGRELGIDVVRADAFETGGLPISSSRIRHLLADEGDVAQAARLLGHPYCMSGTVVEGYQRGRELGYPTANLQIAAEKLLPRDGVYSAQIETEWGCFDAMLNIGMNPTYTNSNRTVEAHLLDFDHSLYGTRVSATLFDRIRDEQPFASADELMQQLLADEQVIRRLMSARRTQP